MNSPRPTQSGDLHTLEMIERIRQEVRKVGFWKNQPMRDLFTRSLVRDLDRARHLSARPERDLAQRLVALAKENHENLIRHDGDIGSR